MTSNDVSLSPFKHKLMVMMATSSNKQAQRSAKGSISHSQVYKTGLDRQWIRKHRKPHQPRQMRSQARLENCPRLNMNKQNSRSLKARCMRMTRAVDSYKWKSKAQYNLKSFKGSNMDSQIGCASLELGRITPIICSCLLLRIAVMKLQLLSQTHLLQCLQLIGI